MANGENAADGFGLTSQVSDTLFESGVNVITSGNHIWQKPDIQAKLKTTDRILRPENYPSMVPGKGHCILSSGGVAVAIANLQGRIDMPNIRCPFRIGRELAERLCEVASVIIFDFHAESLEEKEALSQYLDGKITGLVGTHTHVQTDDERILPKGTAYITDIGMTGPRDSVIGMRKEIAIQRSLTQMPIRMEVAINGSNIAGVLIVADSRTGRACGIERINSAVTP